MPPTSTGLISRLRHLWDRAEPVNRSLAVLALAAALLATLAYGAEFAKRQYHSRTAGEAHLDSVLAAAHAVPLDNGTAFYTIVGSPEEEGPLVEFAEAASGYLSDPRNSGAVRRRFAGRAAEVMGALTEAEAALSAFRGPVYNEDDENLERLLASAEEERARAERFLESSRDGGTRRDESAERRQLTVGRQFDVDLRTGYGLYEAFDHEHRQQVVLAAPDGSVRPGQGGRYRVRNRGREPVEMTYSNAFRSERRTEYFDVYVVDDRPDPREEANARVQHLRREIPRIRQEVWRVQRERRPAFEARATAALDGLRGVMGGG